MATYAIGDVQGCYEPLRYLLEDLKFDALTDELWFVGDLINRGPQSLETLRFVKSLGDGAKTVLGNHDLHLLAVFYGGHEAKNGDTFHDVLSANDCEELAHWLRQLPLLHEDAGWVMTHAGVPHIWDLADARKNAREVEISIGNQDFVAFFEKMYGNEPPVWAEGLDGLDRLRIITNYFTRMRLIADDGTLDFGNKGAVNDDVPVGFRPWFEYPARFDTPVVFGHWASLDGETNSSQMHGIDTGCVWGRTLTALRIDDGRRFVWEPTQA